MELVKPETVGFSSERLARLSRAMQGFVDRQEVAGLVTLVARHGEVAHLESLGMSDVEAGRPMTADTIFRVYSMTKPITAAAVMMLFEEGHFLLDDPVADFIPEIGRMKVFVRETPSGLELAEQERPMTVRHLLTHTSGLIYGEGGSPVAAAYQRAGILRRNEPLAANVARLEDVPLAFQPGSSWAYGISIDVLGRLVEVVSGLTFDRFLKERVFEPLGMADAGFHVPSESIDRLAAVYGSDGNGGLRRVDWPSFDRSVPPPIFSGGGGLVATIGDYASFCQMLLNGGELGGARLLGRKTVDLMTASQTPREQIPVVPPSWSFREGWGMALGVRTLVDVAKSGIPGSAGSYTWGGMLCTDFWVDPAEDLFGILMLQQIEPSRWRPAELLRNLTYQALL